MGQNWGKGVRFHKKKDVRFAGPSTDRTDLNLMLGSRGRESDLSLPKYRFVGEVGRGETMKGEGGVAHFRKEKHLFAHRRLLFCVKKKSCDLSQREKKR